MWWQENYQRLVNRPRTGQWARPQAGRRHAARLGVELLEDRLTPSNFTAATVGQLIADISVANQAGGSNIIVLVGGKSFTLTAADNATDGPTGLPVIAANDNLTIIGNGDTIARSTAAGTPAFRVFDVTSGATLTLEDLTIAHGLSGQGGGILNAGSLTLSHDVLANNEALGDSSTTGAGGAIENVGVSLSVTQTTFRNNLAAGAAFFGALGGAIDSESGLATITASSFSGNQAKGGGAGAVAAGGAINAASTVMSINNSTFTANQALGGDGADGVNTLGGAEGGAISTGFATLAVTNSTFLNNLVVGGAMAPGAPSSFSTTSDGGGCSSEAAR
jgi:hypothetical protein